MVHFCGIVIYHRSIIENAAKLGASVLEWLRKMIAKLRDKAEPEIPEDDIK